MATNHHTLAANVNAAAITAVVESAMFGLTTDEKVSLVTAKEFLLFLASQLESAAEKANDLGNKLADAEKWRGSWRESATQLGEENRSLSAELTMTHDKLATSRREAVLLKQRVKEESDSKQGWITRSAKQDKQIEDLNVKASGYEAWRKRAAVLEADRNAVVKSRNDLLAKQDELAAKAKAYDKLREVIGELIER